MRPRSFGSEQLLRLFDFDSRIAYGLPPLNFRPVPFLVPSVYKARLKANGDVVAIKIQRPNCEEIIALDLYILRWWSGIYNQIFQLLNRDINVQSIIDDFGELIYREIDYVAEGTCKRHS
jgi:ABC1 atypical kinase-like domain